MYYLTQKQHVIPNAHSVLNCLDLPYIKIGKKKKPGNLTVHCFSFLIGKHNW